MATKRASTAPICRLLHLGVAASRGITFVLDEPSSGIPADRSIWSAPRGSPGIQNSVVPDAQRTLACCGPSASAVRSGGILAGPPTWLNKDHRNCQGDIQELPLRTTSQTAKHPKQTKHGPEEQSCCECLSSAQGQKPPLTVCSASSSVEMLSRT